MGITLTGKKIKETYEGLLKLSDNNPIEISYKKVTDGYGNETALGLSVDGVTCDKIYSTQTIAEIDAELDTIVPNKKWVEANNAAVTSFVALSDTFSNMYHRSFGNLCVNSSGNQITTKPSYYDFACGDETSDLTVGNVVNIEFPRVLNNITGIDFTVTTAPTGAPIVMDVLLNGSSVFSGTPRPTIDTNTTSTVNSSVSYFISSSIFTINQGDVLSVNITQVGSTVKGTALKAFLTYDDVVLF